MKLAAAELAGSKTAVICDSNDYRTWSGFPFFSVRERGVEVRRVAFNRVVWC